MDKGYFLSTTQQFQPPPCTRVLMPPSPSNSLYDDEDSDAEQPYIFLCIEQNNHPTVWDPKDG